MAYTARLQNCMLTDMPSSPMIVADYRHAKDTTRMFHSRMHVTLYSQSRP